MSELPAALHKLLAPPEASSHDAWEEFVREYSALLLHVARSTLRGRDAAMDAYAYLLEHLSAEDYRRLRGYAVDPSSKFTTWLVVVAQRLCIDYSRVRFGRVRNAESERERTRIQDRRRLDDLYNGLHDTEEIPDENAVSADHELEANELSFELNAAINSIDPADQLLLRLRFDDGLSAAEIAAILRSPSQFHVYRRLNAVLAALRTKLRERGIESAAS